MLLDDAAADGDAEVLAGPSLEAVVPVAEGELGPLGEVVPEGLLDVAAAVGSLDSLGPVDVLGPIDSLGPVEVGEASAVGSAVACVVVFSTLTVTVVVTGSTRPRSAAPSDRCDGAH